MGPKKKPRILRGAVIPGGLRFRALGGLDENKTAGATFIDELDGAGDLGEKSVIFAATDVCAWLDASAALADDDGTAGNKLSAECFYAKPLRVGVAPVSRTS